MKPLVIYPKYSNVTDERCKETVLDHKTSISATFSLPSSDHCLCNRIISWYSFLHVSKRQSMRNMQIKHCNFQVFGGNELLLLEVNFQCLWKIIRGELLQFLLLPLKKWQSLSILGCIPVSDLVVMGLFASFCAIFSSASHS